MEAISISQMHRPHAKNLVDRELVEVKRMSNRAYEMCCGRTIKSSFVWSEGDFSCVDRVLSSPR